MFSFSQQADRQHGTAQRYGGHYNAPCDQQHIEHSAQQVGKAQPGDDQRLAALLLLRRGLLKLSGQSFRVTQSGRNFLFRIAIRQLEGEMLFIFCLDLGGIGGILLAECFMQQRDKFILCHFRHPPIIF